MPQQYFRLPTLMIYGCFLQKRNYPALPLLGLFHSFCHFPCEYKLLHSDDVKTEAAAELPFFGKITHELFPRKQSKSACGDLIRVLIILRLNLQISLQYSVLYLSRYIGTVAHKINKYIFLTFNAIRVLK